MAIEIDRLLLRCDVRASGAGAAIHRKASAPGGAPSLALASMGASSQGPAGSLASTLERAALANEARILQGVMPRRAATGRPTSVSSPSGRGFSLKPKAPIGGVGGGLERAALENEARLLGGLPRAAASTPASWGGVHTAPSSRAFSSGERVEIGAVEIASDHPDLAPDTPIGRHFRRIFQEGVERARLTLSSIPGFSLGDAIPVLDVPFDFWPEEPEEGIIQRVENATIAAALQAEAGRRRVAPLCALDVRNPPWNQVKEVKKSAQGAVSGVYFLYTPEGKLVVKPSPTPGNEAFALDLARALGIAAPAFALVPVGPEMAQVAGASGGGDLYADACAKDHLLVMEFVEGYTLLQMTPDQAPAVFGGEAGKRVLRDIGALAAYDMVTYNTDRFRLSDSDVGNTGNIMFTAADGKVVAIDQAVGTSRQNPDVYRQVSSFVAAVMGDPDRPTGLAERIRQQILEATTYDIGAAGALELHRGMADGIRKIAGLKPELLGEIRDRLGGNVRGMEDINVDWLTELMDTCRMATGPN